MLCEQGHLGVCKGLLIKWKLFNPTIMRNTVNDRGESIFDAFIMNGRKYDPAGFKNAMYEVDGLFQYFGSYKASRILDSMAMAVCKGGDVEVPGVPLSKVLATLRVIQPNWFKKKQNQWEDIFDRMMRGVPQADGKVWSMYELESAIVDERKLAADEMANALMRTEEVHGRDLCKNKKRCTSSRRTSPTDMECATAVPVMECAICLEEIDDASATLLGCSHVYHATCLKGWTDRCNLLELISTCPMCRWEVGV
jgi:hypothetical protein